MERGIVVDEQAWVDDGRPDYDPLLREIFATRFDELAAPIPAPLHISIETSTNVGPSGFLEAKQAAAAFVQNLFDPLYSSVSLSTFSSGGFDFILEAERDPTVIANALDDLAFAPEGPGFVPNAIEAVLHEQDADYPSGTSFLTMLLTALDPEAAATQGDAYFNQNNLWRGPIEASGDVRHLVFTSGATLPSSSGPCAPGADAKDRLEAAGADGQVIFLGVGANWDDVGIGCLVDDPSLIALASDLLISGVPGVRDGLGFARPSDA
ncbi:MAG: hypothetical protein AAF968_22900 [Pseudomonadota bacterium]